MTSANVFRAPVVGIPRHTGGGAGRAVGVGRGEWVSTGCQIRPVLRSPFALAQSAIQSP